MQNTVTDLIRESIALADLSTRLNWLSVLLALGVALICGVLIYLVYRFFYRGAVYNDNFNVLLVMVTMITAFIIMTVSSNLALSLGMVGALSIVRFRAAIKDPLDVGFIFWAVAAGLTAGAGLYLVALLGSVVIAIIYIIFNWAKAGVINFLTIIKYDSEVDEKIKSVLNDYKYSVKSKTQIKGKTELIIETKKIDGLMERIEGIKEVESVSQIEYNGDYLG